MYSSSFNNLDLFILVQLIYASIATPCLLLVPDYLPDMFFFSRFHPIKLLLVLLFVFFDNAASIFVRFDRDAGVRK